MIQFHDVRKSYPEFDMRIDFSIGEGELVSILGPSGSGKTTTLRLIAGFERPDRGRIVIDGRDVTAMSPAERQIGYVFQDYTLFPHMDVATNVGYGLRVRHRSPEEIERKVSELLELVDLPGYQRRNVETLSGGERQRVAIARALAVDPVLLLLDEPFSSIDEVLRRDLRDEIVRLQKRLGITVVFVTHSQQEALAISDRVAVLRDGDVIQYDEVETLYRAPCNRFVAAFVGEANFFPATTHASPHANAEDQGRTLVLRPEQLELIGPEDSPTGSADRVVLDAVIETHQFLGATHRYACRHDEGVAIVKDQRRFVVGASVQISYAVGKGYLLPEAGSNTAPGAPGGER